MIESIEIKNFRCFKDTKIAKFGLVNLIGGMNNAGKTALLEAVYLTVSPTAPSLMFLHKNVRREDPEFGKEKPENVWDNLFFQQNKNEKITLSCVNDSKDRFKITLDCNEEAGELVNFIENLDDDDEELNHFQSILLEEETAKSVLHLNVYKNTNKEHSPTLIANSLGIVARSSVSDSKFNTVNFIQSSVRRSSSRLAKQYDNVCHRSDEKEKAFLRGMKIIDRSIKQAKTSTLGNGGLYLQRENEEMMPITLFGDAITRVADFILRIINNPNSIILIDEIENGIHFTAQAELWEMLFKLADAYGTQIFATSHSFEMIKAFAKVAQEFPDKAAYFEMARHAKTGNIIGSSIPIDVLNYDIENHAPFRGE